MVAWQLVSLNKMANQSVIAVFIHNLFISFEDYVHYLVGFDSWFSLDGLIVGVKNRYSWKDFLVQLIWVMDYPNNLRYHFQNPDKSILVVFFHSDYLEKFIDLCFGEFVYILIFKLNEHSEVGFPCFFQQRKWRLVVVFS